MIFEKEKLLNCLGIIEKALPVRSPIPIINNIYFRCQEDEVIFLATNLEMEITCRLPYPSRHSFIMLLASRVIDVIRYLPDRKVEITYNSEDRAVNIKSGEARYFLYGADPAEYPVSTAIPVEHTSVTINQALLKQALRQVVFASSSEEGRPVFAGLLFSFEQQGIIITASDTYRVAITEISAPNNLTTPHQLLVPARSIRELIKILSDEDQSMTIGFHKNQVVFDFKGVNVIAKVLDERFPDITGVIPSGFQTRLELSRQSLEEIVTRASLLAEGVNKAVCFSLSESGLQITASSQAGKMEEYLEVKVEGDKCEVYLNSRFLLEMIKSVNCEMLSVEFNGQSGPVIFRPVGDNHYLYLVLPIKMTQELS